MLCRLVRQRLMHLSISKGPRRSVLLGAVLLVVASGCSESETIRNYEIDADRPRLLAAMIPHGEKVWFFKLVGPAPLVDNYRDDFRSFIESISFGGSGRPSWKLPSGWTEDKERDANKIRYSTIHLNKYLEISVTSLAMADQTASVVANVNRWRRIDLGLPPASKQEIDKSVEKIQIDGVGATLVDMLGARSYPVVKRKKPRAEPSFDYEVPKGWKKQKAATGFTLAKFVVEEDDKRADVSITSVGGSPAANINRWRGQVGLPRQTSQEMIKEVKTIMCGDRKALYVDLKNPEQPAGKTNHILGVVLPTESGRMYFFKMSGPTELVEKLKLQFEAFVRSARLTD